MDPQANLAEQRQLATEILNPDLHDESEIEDMLSDLEKKATRLAELVQALDEWRKNGGYDPYKP